jgi:DNA-3-methyladenine glycosylase
MIVTSSRFFAQPTLAVAQDLLGKILVVNNKAGIITETEAYIGEQDAACHARFGRTKRSETLYAPAGTVYVYLCYGRHWMLNLVSEKENFPAAVLVRGIAVCDPILKSYFLNPKSLLTGPGKVTKYLDIDQAMNGQMINKSALKLHKNVDIRPRVIRQGPRIGIAYASEPWRSKPWRFWI